MTVHVYMYVAVVRDMALIVLNYVLHSFMQRYNFIYTLARFFSKANPIAFPMPLAPPVITATQPSIFILCADVCVQVWYVYLSR